VLGLGGGGTQEQGKDRLFRTRHLKFGVPVGDAFLMINYLPRFMCHTWR
jgi:hypothetical protein